MPSTFYGYTQASLFVFFDASFLTTLDLAVLINVSLQGFEVLVVKIRYICSVLKNLCHGGSFLKIIPKYFWIHSGNILPPLRGEKPEKSEISRRARRGSHPLLEWNVV